MTVLIMSTMSDRVGAISMSNMSDSVDNVDHE